MKGHIRQRTKGRWEITIDIGRDPVTEKRLRHFETITGTKGEAQRRLAELQVDMEKGTYVKPRRLTLAAWLSQWLDAYVTGILWPKVAESYRQQIQDYIIPRLGYVRLSELRPHHIQEYISWALSAGRRLRRGGLSHRTVQYHYRILSKAMDDAIRAGILAVNPCKAVRPPRPRRHDIPALGPDSLHILMESMAGTSYGQYYLTLLYTGLRRGELLALKWRDTDLDLACIFVAHSLHRLDDGTVIIKEPKTTRSRRRVDLPPSLALQLRKHQADQVVNALLAGRTLSEDDFVFSHPDGSPLNPNSVTHTFSKAAARAGMPGLRLHDLRHIHATLMLKDGVHPKIVSERLGHANVGITLDTYSHVLPGLQEAAAERFDGLLPSMEPDENVGKMSA